MTRLVFIDVETTGLEPDRHGVWEIGAIVRTEDGDHEYLWEVWPDPVQG
ncbi:hypothetical protein [Carbonactinospora thermoautotrophica]|nr:hypothetical protein [Carbonactinospora thermoautotrophica]